MQNFSWELCVKEKWVIQDHGPWTGCGAAPCEPTRCKDATSRRSGFGHQETPNSRLKWLSSGHRASQGKLFFRDNLILALRLESRSEFEQ